MCGRFMLTSPTQSIRATFGVNTHANIPARYNIAPMQPTLIIRRALSDGGTGAAEGDKELAAVQWGLVPGWMKEVPTSRPMINARSETVTQKPSFRAAYRRRHCLVPADGWYEWVKTDRGARQPYLIRPKSDGARPFAMAGIWELWHGPGGEDWLESMAILTMPAMASIAAIQDRMPVVLDHGAQDAWLAIDPHLGEYPRHQHALDGLTLIGSDTLEAVAVSPRLNNARHDHPDVLEPPLGHQASLF